MNKVYFMNNGDFDVRAMMTMGVSAKSEDAVGFFGTGFKYAVAIILRLGGTVNIKTLSGEYLFTARRETIRDKEFQIVYMNDREAGFTTHLGINWEPWMAYRELYCNATDEGGKADIKPDDEYDTVIEVECSDIRRAHDSSSDYFLRGEPIFSTHEVEIYATSKPFIYYRGIAVKNAYENSMFSYNITDRITLTEDRTVRNDYEVLWPIRRAIQRCTDKVMLRKCLKPGEHAEAKIGFDRDWGASDEFIDVCQELMRQDRGLCESARILVSDLKAKAGDWPEFELNSVQEKMLDKAKRFLYKIDIDVDRFPIKTVIGLGDGVMGRAHDDTIFLSEIPFNQGTKQLASTLMEEWVHLKYGVDDFDRQMQNWLFDKILSLGEVINGEPI